MIEKTYLNKPLSKPASTLTLDKTIVWSMYKKQWLDDYDLPGNHPGNSTAAIARATSPAPTIVTESTDTDSGNCNQNSTALPPAVKKTSS